MKLTSTPLLVAYAIKDPSRTTNMMGQSRPPSPLLGTCTAAVAFGAVYAVLAWGVLPRPWALIVPAALIVATPVSPKLTRRIAINGALVLGWVPLLWLVPWPLEVNHGALICGVGAAGLAGWVTASPNSVALLRMMVPKFRWVDLLIVMSGVGAFVTVHRWASVTTPTKALKLFLPGYDNVAHFNMFFVTRLHGSTIGNLATAPDGSAWTYSHYPPGFHVILATVAEVVHPRVGTGPTELVLYAHVAAAVIVFATIVLVSAICSLPALEHRGLVAIPAVALTTTAFLWQPGAQVLADGFANFWLAAVLASCALVLSMSRGPLPSVLLVAAVSGSLFAAALTWTPLAVLAAPAALVVLPRWRRIGDEARGSLLGMWVCIGLLTLGLLGFVKAALMVKGTVAVSTLVEATGQVNGTSLAPVLLLLVLAVYGCAGHRSLLLRAANEERQSHLDRKVTLLAITPVLGFVALAALLGMQLRSLGTTSYYFLKLLVGFELILVPMVGGLLAVLFVSLVPVQRNRFGAVVLSTVMAVGATQFFGHLAWTSAPMLTERDFGTDVQGKTLYLAAMAQGIVDSTGAIETPSLRPMVYVALGRGRGYEPNLPASWSLAIGDGITDRSFTSVRGLGVTVSDPIDASEIIRDLLEQDSSAQVIVAPRYVDAVRAELSSPDQAARVVTWP